MINMDGMTESDFTDFVFVDNETEDDQTRLSKYFSHLANEPALATRYMYWGDTTQGGFTYAGIALRITEDDACTMTLITKQNSRFYTHLRNRTAWTGPYLSVTLIDIGGVPVGDTLQLGQNNRICGQTDVRITKSFNVPGAFSLANSGTFSATAYRQWSC